MELAQPPRPRSRGQRRGPAAPHAPARCGSSLRPARTPRAPRPTRPSLLEKVASDAGQQVVARAATARRTSASTTSRPPAGPSAIDTATARLSSTTGEGVSVAEIRRTARRSATQSVSSAVRARAWHAAIAPAARTGPGVRRAPRPARALRVRGRSAAGPTTAVLVQQQHGLACRPDPGRGCARPGSPSAPPARAPPARVGRQLGQDPAQPQRLLAELRPQPVLARGRRVALVEDEVDDLEHRRQPVARVSAPPAPRTARLAAASVRLARTMRCATVGSGTRNARAISSVVSPPSTRRVSADPRLGREHRVAGGEDQPQQVVARCPRRARLDLGAGPLRPAREVAAQLRRACARASRCAGSGRSPGAAPSASARRPGCPARPSAGHCSSAATSASWARSSPAPGPASHGPARQSAAPTRCAIRRRCCAEFRDLHDVQSTAQRAARRARACDAHRSAGRARRTRKADAQGHAGAAPGRARHRPVHMPLGALADDLAGARLDS